MPQPAKNQQVVAVLRRQRVMALRDQFEAKEGDFRLWQLQELLAEFEQKHGLVKPLPKKRLSNCRFPGGKVMGKRWESDGKVTGKCGEMRENVV